MSVQKHRNRALSREIRIRAAFSRLACVRADGNYPGVLGRHERSALIRSVSIARTGSSGAVDDGAQRHAQCHDDVLAYDGRVRTPDGCLRRQQRESQLRRLAKDRRVRDRRPGSKAGIKGGEGRQLLGARRRQICVIRLDAEAGETCGATSDS